MLSGVLRAGLALHAKKPRNVLSTARSMSTRPNVSTGKSNRARYFLAGFGGLAMYMGGVLYPPDTLRMLYPIPAPAPISDLSSPEAIAHMENLETALQSLTVLKEKREAPDASEWYETRPYANTPPERRGNHLTGGALRGPGKLGVTPVVRAKKDESEAWIIMHLGRGLCGHDGIIHGGLLATLLDESLGREAIMNLPEKVGVTATLTVHYKAPTRADQFVVIKTKVDELKGRKVFVSGSIEDLSSKTLVTATGMFVQPKYAHLLNQKIIAEAIGERVPAIVPPASDGQALT